MSSPGPSPAPDWGARAGEASRAVTGLFGRRLFFLPGTHLAATIRPAGRLAGLADPWHYWWQAHYLDCLLDAARRDPGSGAGRLARRLLTGIRLRNLLTVVNNYYDDMGWLALAALRLDRHAAAGRDAEGLAATGPTAGILRALTGQLDSACTADLGGGTFWNTTRDFKNTPATAPAALYYARTGRSAEAQRLLDWLDARLYDPDQGLYRDGLRMTAAGEVALEAAIYSYNQGPVLGALLELGGTANLARAAGLVDAVARRLTAPAGGAPAPSTPAPVAEQPVAEQPVAEQPVAEQPVAEQRGRAVRPRTVLRGEGTGDGGLFTGILVRYLALAARDGRLPAPVRETAASLVLDTAGAFWAGRRAVGDGEPLARYGGSLVFSARPEQPATQTYPPGTAVELSTQLQAWMTLEAAASVTAPAIATQAN